MADDMWERGHAGRKAHGKKKVNRGGDTKGMDAKSRQRLKKQEQEERHAARDKAKAAKQAAKAADSEAKHLERQRLRAAKRRKVKEDREIRRQMRERRAVEQQDKQRQLEVTRVANLSRIDAKLSKAKAQLRARIVEMGKRSAEAVAFSRREHLAFERSRSFAVSGMAGFGVTDEGKLLSVSVEGVGAAFEAPNVPERLADAGLSGKETELLSFTDVVKVASTPLVGLAQHAAHSTRGRARATSAQPCGQSALDARVHSVALCHLMGEDGCVVVGSNAGVMLFSMADDRFEPVSVEVTGRTTSGHARQVHVLDGTQGCALMAVDSGSGLIVACMSDSRVMLVSCAVQTSASRSKVAGADGGAPALEFACWFDNAGWLEPAVMQALVQFGRADSTEQALAMVGEMRATSSRAITTPMKMWLNGSLLVAALRIELEGGSGFAVADVSTAAPGAGGALEMRFVDSSLRSLTATGWQCAPIPPVVLTLPRRLDDDAGSAVSVKKQIAMAMTMLDDSFADETDHHMKLLQKPEHAAEAAPAVEATAEALTGAAEPPGEGVEPGARPEEKARIRFLPFRGRSGAAAALGAQAASSAFVLAHPDGVKAAESGVQSAQSCTPQQVAACAGAAAALALDHARALRDRVAGALRRARVVLAAMDIGGAKGGGDDDALRPERKARAAGAAAARAYARTMVSTGAESSTAAEADCAFAAAQQVMEGYGMEVLEFHGHIEEDPLSDDDFMEVSAPTGARHGAAAAAQQTRRMSSKQGQLPPINETAKPGSYSRDDGLGGGSAELVPKFVEAGLAGVAASMASLAKGGNQALPHRVAAAAARGAARVMEGAKGARPLDIALAAAEAAGASVANRKFNPQHRYFDNTGPAASGDAAFDAAVRFGMMGAKPLRNVAFTAAGKAAAMSVVGVDEGSPQLRAMRRAQAERGVGVIADASAAAGAAAAAACEKAHGLVGEDELLKGACNLKEKAVVAGRAAGLAASQLGASMKAAGKAAATATLACGGCGTDAILAAASAAAAAARFFSLGNSAAIEAAAASAATEAEAAARKSGGSAVSRAATEAARAARCEGAKPEQEVLAAGAGAAICVISRANADATLAWPEGAWFDAAVAAGAAAGEAHAAVRKRVNKRRQPVEEAKSAAMAAAIAVMRYWCRRPRGEAGHESDGDDDDANDGEGLDVVQDTLVVLGGKECWRGLFFQPDGLPAQGQKAKAAGRGEVIWHERPTALGYSHPFLLTAYGGKGSLEVRNVFNGHVVQNISLPPGGADTLLASNDLKLMFAATSSAVAMLRRRSPLLKPAVLRRPWQDKQTMLTRRKENTNGVYLLMPLPVGLPKPPEEIVLEQLAQRLRDQEAAPTALQRQAQWLHEMKAKKAAEAHAQEVARREKNLVDRESVVGLWAGEPSIAVAAPGDSVARGRWKAGFTELQSLKENLVQEAEVAPRVERFKHARNEIESQIPTESLRALAEQLDLLETGGSAMSSEGWAEYQATEQAQLPCPQPAPKHAESAERYIVGVVCKGDVPKAAQLLRKARALVRPAKHDAASNCTPAEKNAPAPPALANTRPSSKLGTSKKVWRERDRDRKSEASRRAKLAEVGSPFAKMFLEATSLSAAGGTCAESVTASLARSSAKAVRRLHKRHGTGFLNHGKLRFDAISNKPREVRSALHIAAGSGSTEVVRALLEGGAALDKKDLSGCSPLHWAAARLDEDGFAVAQILLEHGARDDIENEMGKTPYAWAERCGNGPVASLLKDHRAKLDAAAAAVAEADARNPFHS